MLSFDLLCDVSLDAVSMDPYTGKYIYKNRDLSVAVVGFGKMGLLHSSILNLLKPNIVRFIVEKSRLVTLGGSFLIKNVNFFNNLEKLLAKETIDAIYITTPIRSHFSIAKRVLEAGVKALFIEKPPTFNLNELLELVDLSKGSITMVGFQKRYAFPFRHAKRLLNNGVIGDVKNVKCYIKSGDIVQPTNKFKTLGRGVLLDLGIHLIDLLKWFFQDLEVEEANFKSIYTGADDVFKAELSTGDARVEFETTWSDSSFRLPETYLEFVGDQGVLRVTEDYLKVGLEKPDPIFGERDLAIYKPHYYQSFPPVLVADPEYTIEDIHFLSCLAKGIQPLTSLESSIEVMKILEELYGRAMRG